MPMQKSGLTLLEILLTVGLITVLSVASVPVFLRFESRNNLTLAADAVKSGLQTARDLADSEKNDAKWGVKVLTGSDNKVVVFEGNSYSSRDTDQDREIDIVDSLSVSGPSSEPEFVFNSDGDLEDVLHKERVKLSTNSYGLEKTITVGSSGRVSVFRYPPSCEAANYDSVVSGETQIDPDADGQNPVGVYCDREVDGGGWTLVAKWDRDWSSGWDQSLPQDAVRKNINVDGNLDTINVGANQTATLNARPLIRNGATEMMHVAREDGDSTTDGNKWRKTYFSQIYQSVRDNPDNLFDPSLDTNTGEGVAGSCEQGFHPDDEKQAWFDSSYQELPDDDLEGYVRNKRIVTGEGKAMFTNGNREGAVYSSHNINNCEGNPFGPYVNWGFYGKDGSQQSYRCTSLHVGTSCDGDSTADNPAHRLNFMFVR